MHKKDVYVIKRDNDSYLINWRFFNTQFCGKIILKKI